MYSPYSSLLTAGYGLAAVANVVLVVLFLTRFRGRLQSGYFAAAALVTALWSSCIAIFSVSLSSSGIQLFLLEIAHGGAWLLLLSALFRGAVSGERSLLFNRGGVALTAILLSAGSAYEVLSRFGVVTGNVGNLIGISSILIALFALVMIEQIFRNAREAQRVGLKYLCLGLACYFTYDLFMYSNAALTGELDKLVWAARGVVVAMCTPLFVIAARHSPRWSSSLFVSRHIVFHTAALFSAGVYLTVIGFIGYFLRVEGEDWGGVVQFLFASAAIILLFMFVLSTRLRQRLRVFISKHFFENRFDYRQEWLRLNQTLTSTEDQLPLDKRAIKALAQIVGSNAGQLWLLAEDEDKVACMAGWNAPRQTREILNSDVLTGFLRTQKWIIEFDELSRQPDQYKGLSFTDIDFDMDNAAYLVPLFQGNLLLGFVLLAESAGRPPLNYEDRDLLKTASQQIGIHLVQERSSEKLSESRQFETYNRLTAFIMHDLKNLVAQQSLLVENAKKHKSNAAFVDDMIATVKASVTRMRRVLANLRGGTVQSTIEKVELGKLVLRATSNCADRRPYPSAELTEFEIWVRADRDMLLMALCHTIRNAQEASTPDGSVVVRLEADGKAARLHVIDKGCGMDEMFLKDRLFKPFDSTKGTQGMGIGAYQIRETMRAIGGDVAVESAVGEGTRVILTFDKPIDASARSNAVAGM